MTNLLIIDDDDGLYNLLAEYLGGEGFTCSHAPDGETGLSELRKNAWDVVILDVMLPGSDGYQVLETMRGPAMRDDTPVIMLTARGEEDDRIAGLEMGADDYLAKPFAPRELVARLRALLRRSGHAAPAAEADGGVRCVDDLAVNKASMCVVANGNEMQLSAAELRALDLFFESPGKVIDRETLTQKIFGHRVFPQDRSLDMMISRLRKKLGPRKDGGERIRAVRGEGYAFLLSGDAQ